MIKPLDMPDDYLWLPGSGKSQLGDLGELAARMGSPVTYDRRGSVYWFDDFEDGLSPWLTTNDGAGGSVDIVVSPTFRGGFSCQLVTDDAGGNLASIIKRLAPALLTTYGAEFTFSTLENGKRLYSFFQYNTGTKKYLAGISCHITDGKLYYYSSAGVWTEIDDLVIDDDDKYLFYTAKLVVDLQSKEYVRVLFNQMEYDISGQEIKESADITVPRIEVSFGVTAEGANAATAFIDSVIITIGDP